MSGAVETADVVVVGAGVAGLACARSLAGRGLSPVIYERSRGLGGRCATRRVHDQPVDHGSPFVHGSDDAFLAAIEAVPAHAISGWPRVVEGEGVPCLPKAFIKGERRLAFAEGLTAFPKHLAQGLTVRLQARVESLEPSRGGVVVTTEAGQLTHARTVVLAVPAPTALRFVSLLSGGGREMDSIAALVRMIGSQACLTALAGYPAGSQRPRWEMAYPQDSVSVQSISHDSSKRLDPRFVVLVIQARPCWSQSHLDEPERGWLPLLLAEAGRVVGDWAGTPEWAYGHRWHFARSDRGSELSRPVCLKLRGGGRVIVTGESFAPGGGIEASWLAGNAAAARVVEEE